MQLFNPRSQTSSSLDWMYEEQDDFLSGKTPHEIEHIWEDEE